MAATRMFAPKVASLMGSTSAKVARPILRSSVKANGSQRAFSGRSYLPRYLTSPQHSFTYQTQASHLASAPMPPSKP
jgi:F-type H+-transporting ATPase subunit c